MKILKPIITEKTVQLAENENKYTFAVADSANKKSAAGELSDIFGVTVEKVWTHNRIGKPYSHGKYRRLGGRKPSTKLMIFKLKDGDKISEFSE